MTTDPATGSLEIGRLEQFLDITAREKAAWWACVYRNLKRKA